MTGVVGVVSSRTVVKGSASGTVIQYGKSADALRALSINMNDVHDSSK